MPIGVHENDRSVSEDAGYHMFRQSPGQPAAVPSAFIVSHGRMILVAMDQLPPEQEPGKARRKASPAGVHRFI